MKIILEKHGNSDSEHKIITADFSKVKTGFRIHDVYGYEITDCDIKTIKSCLGEHDCDIYECVDILEVNYNCINTFLNKEDVNPNFVYAFDDKILTGEELLLTRMDRIIQFENGSCSSEEIHEWIVIEVDAIILPVQKKEF